MPELIVGAVQLDLLTDANIEISGDSVFAKASRSEWAAEVAADDNGVFTALIAANAEVKNSVVISGMLRPKPGGQTLKNLQNTGGPVAMGHHIQKSP